MILQFSNIYYIIRREVLEYYAVSKRKKIDSPNLKVAKNSVARGYDGVYAYSVAHFFEDINCFQRIL